jgi:hypothetical protein
MMASLKAGSSDAQCPLPWGEDKVGGWEDMQGEDEYDPCLALLASAA